MGKICGLGYLDEKGNVVYLRSDDCFHEWYSFGTIKIAPNMTFRPYIQYLCEWYPKCVVDFKFYYDSEGIEQWWNNVDVDWGTNWVSPSALRTPQETQWIIVSAYERDAFGNRVLQDQIFFLVEILKPASFQVTSITPSKTYLNVGETISVKVTVANTGDVGGYAHVTLKVDGSPVGTKVVWINGRSSEIVTFTYTATRTGVFDLCAEVV